MKTTLAIENDATRAWHLVDATDKPAGRLASAIALILRGKDRPDFTPHVDTGAFVIVVNAQKVKLTGAKEDLKMYKHFTGYPSGLKHFPAKQIRQKNPERIIMQAVKGMLPKHNLARTQLTRLKVYAGAEHPHAAQKPAPLNLDL